QHGTAHRVPSWELRTQVCQTGTVPRRRGSHSPEVSDSEKGEGRREKGEGVPSNSPFSLLPSPLTRTADHHPHCPAHPGTTRTTRPSWLRPRWGPRSWRYRRVNHCTSHP